jgi:hypothetical protein
MSGIILPFTIISIFIILPLVIFIAASRYLFLVRKKVFILGGFFVKFLWWMSAVCLWGPLGLSALLVYESIVNQGANSCSGGCGFELLLIPILAIPGLLLVFVLAIFAKKLPVVTL